MHEFKDHDGEIPKSGKCILVVGASRGIGWAVTQRLVQTGHRVSGWARTVPSMHPHTEAAGQLEFRSVDVRDASAMHHEFQRAADRDRRPDVVVYCAGIVGRGPVGGISPVDWRDAFEVNVIGAHAVLDRYVRTFDRHPSRVIALASEAALFPAPERSAYASSKAALGALMSSYREEARSTGTTVSVLYLGKVNTALSSRSAAENKRALQPADVADVVVGLVELAPHVEVRSMELTSVRSDYG